MQLDYQEIIVNSAISHHVVASDYLMGCHQALFLQQDTLVY